MKLATKRNGTRDGELIVVSKDLSQYCSASEIAPNLQTALDNWVKIAPQLASLSERLNAGKEAGQPFDDRACHSPLPRAFQWADGSA